MAHEGYEDRFFFRDQPAWHKLGQVVPLEWSGTVEEAFKVAKADYEILKVPAYGELPGGQRIQAPDRSLLVRGASYGSPAKYLADVHTDYPVIQNLDIARMLEPFNKVWKIETVCCLRDGAHLVVTFKVGTTYVGKGGDEVKEFWLLSEHRNANTPMLMKATDVRVVCNNTFQAALTDGAAVVKVPHYHTKFLGDVQWALDSIAEANAIRDRIRVTYNQMAATYLGEKEAEEIIAALFPEPTAPDADVIKRIEDFKVKQEAYERERARVLLMRSDMTELHGRLGDQFRDAQAEGTAWHLFGTATQFFTSYKGRQVEQGVLFGERGRQIEQIGQLLATRSAASSGSGGSSVAVMAPPAVATFPHKTGAAPLTSEQRAANALYWLKQRVEERNDRRFVDADVASDASGLYRRAALAWLAGTERNGNAFINDFRRQAERGDTLSDRQIRVTLDVMAAS